MFHVYVEGVTGTGPDAVRQLSDAMANRYGLPAAEVHARLTRGRFRVKANVDEATANLYARDLEAIGARVRIEEARAASIAPAARAKPPSDRQVLKTPRGIRVSPAIVPRSSTSLPPQPEARPSLSTLPPQPAARPALSTLPPQPEARPVPSTLPPQPAARPTRPSLPPHVASRPSTPALPAHVASRPSTPALPAHVASRPSRTWRAVVDPSIALDAESSGDAPMNLGALDRSGLLSLATLDDEPSQTAGAPFSPSDRAPPEIAPALPRPASPPPVQASREPAPSSPDRFAPPGAASEDLVVELADDELAYRAHKRMSSPPQVAAESPPRSTPGVTAPATRTPAMPPGPPTTPRLAPTPQHRPEAVEPRINVATERRSPASPRVRFAAGVVLAIVLGFIPAHVVAAMREQRAFHAIDARVIAAQDAADSQQSYDALDAMRAAQLDAKHSAQRRIALASMLIWAVAGGAIAYVWFRRIAREQPGS